MLFAALPILSSSSCPLPRFPDMAGVISSVWFTIFLNSRELLLDKKVAASYTFRKSYIPFLPLSLVLVSEATPGPKL